MPTRLVWIVQRCPCLCLLDAGTKGVCHSAQLSNAFVRVNMVAVFFLAIAHLAKTLSQKCGAHS